MKKHSVFEPEKHIPALVICMLMLFGCLGTWGVNRQTETLCLKSKFIDHGGDSGSHYILVDVYGRTFEIDRAVTNMFNPSSNPDVIYSNMEIGHIYKIETTGYRIDVAYNYPLIQKIDQDLGTCCDNPSNPTSFCYSNTTG
jgi:hypothetical protein